MDVNGTRFFGILDEAAWRACRLDDQPASVEAWPEEGSEPWLRVAWDKTAGGEVTLRRLPAQLPVGRAPAARLGPEARRGAGHDGRGNWYWIAADRGSIVWQPAGGGAPTRYWPTTSAPCPPPEPAGFRPVAAPPRPTPRLAGLAVTIGHSLVVGEPATHALHLFDLEAGGPPTTLTFPPPFAPFDLAPMPDGGVAVLDRANECFWVLDRHFAVVLDPAGAAAQPDKPDFAAVDGAPPPAPAVCPPPSAFPLGLADPIAIEALPDGQVVVLGRPDVPGGPSLLLFQALSRPVAGPLPLPELPDDPDGTPGGALAGHDIAASPDEAGQTLLYVLEAAGRQAFAFRLERDGAATSLLLLPDHLPLHQPGGRGLVGGAEGPFYDVTAAGEDARTRWVRLRAIDRPRFVPDAALETPVFPAAERGCNWHRVFIDGCLPPGSALRILARAHDDPALLPQAPFVPQPVPYRRALGAEIPFVPAPPSGSGEGTHETLLQDLRGRHAQLRIEIAGNGRVSPRLRRLRLYGPRFSYPAQYLPALYRDDAASASFLERMLANMEGLLAQIEGSIADLRVILDPASAPAEALDWLAGWLGLVLDPIWSSAAAGSDDRRRLLIRCAPLLFERRGTVEGLTFALLLYLDPCLPALLRRIERATAVDDPVLRQALAAFGVAYPPRGAGRQACQALFFAFVAAARRPSPVRIVEHFLARGGRGVAAGLPAQDTAALADDAAAHAHRFTILLPEGLSPDDAGMAERIVALEKPAHTSFALRRYSAALRVGQARVGVDTVVGLGARFTALRLGTTPLAQGWLAGPHPFDIANRLIAGRDRIGRLPPL